MERKRIVRHEYVVGVVTAEMVPVLMIPAAEYQLTVGTAAVVDGWEVVTDRAQVREFHVSFTDTFTAARQHL